MDLILDRESATEPWAVAADALAPPGEPGPVLAVDLSGDPLRFRVDPGNRYALRPITPADLLTLSDWLARPHVARWWDDGSPEHAQAEEYARIAAGQEATRGWIFEVNGRSVGYCQDYRISDHPEYALLSKRPEAVAIDYLLGEEALVGKGVGTALLWIYLRDIVWPAYRGTREFFAAPDHRNGASRRVLAKLGFTEGLWFDEPQPGGRIDTVVGNSLDVSRVIGAHPATEE